MLKKILLSLGIMLIIFVNTAYAYTIRIHLWNKTEDIVGVISHNITQNYIIIDSCGTIKKTTIFALREILYIEIINN